MSLEEDVRVEEFDKLIQYYWECLSSSLIKLEYKGHIPSLKDIQNDVLRRSSFGKIISYTDIWRILIFLFSSCTTYFFEFFCFHLR